MSAAKTPKPLPDLVAELLAHKGTGGQHITHLGFHAFLQSRASDG